jgi:hypothetical protein
MSKMKNILAMTSMFAALAMTGQESPRHRERDEPKETDEEKKRRLAKAEIERNKANGLKEFFYGRESVWAINQKNADKKARSKHWL